MTTEDRSDHVNLISALLLEAGRIMEDTSPELALKLPEDPEGASARIVALETAAHHLVALAAAARALLRQGSE
jgi:hypothetical protein